MSLFGVELNAQVNRIQIETRLQLSKNKFFPNLRTLYRSFASFDQQMNGRIALTHFEKALNKQGIFYKANDMKILAKAYMIDSDTALQINWFQFLSHLKQQMGPVRRDLIQSIYDSIFQKAEGNKVNKDVLLQYFQAENVDLCKDGKCAKEYIQAQLISLLVFSEDETVSKEQFVAFYDDLSFNFCSNEAFVRAICQQWNWQYQIPKQVTEEQLRGTLKALRFKLIQKSGGTKDEFLMRKLFEEYDENKNGFINTYELDLMLKDLQLPTEPRLIQPLLIKLDKNKSGNIEYDELRRFIFFDPFL